MNSLESSSNKIKKYIDFTDGGTSPTGITRIWNVPNKRTGENCGQIRWHGAFRKYCFFPSDGFLFDSDCLYVIAAKLVEVNARRKEARRRAKIENPNAHD